MNSNTSFKSKKSGKQFSDFCFVVLLLLSIKVESQNLRHSYGKTKKIEPTFGVNEKDTLIAFIPFLQKREINNLQTWLDIQYSPFKKDIVGIDYTNYSLFYDKPTVKVFPSKKNKEEGTPVTYPSYYQIYFEFPLQKLLNNKLNYLITQVDDEKRKNILGQELKEIEIILRDSFVIELNISEELCQQLSFYKKRYFLITHILEYYLDDKYDYFGTKDFVWHRMFVIDIISKKIILYRNVSDPFRLSREQRGYFVYNGLNNLIKKLSPILPEESKSKH